MHNLFIQQFCGGGNLRTVRVVELVWKATTILGGAGSVVPRNPIPPFKAG